MAISKGKICRKGFKCHKMARVSNEKDQNRRTLESETHNIQVPAITEWPPPSGRASTKIYTHTLLSCNMAANHSDSYPFLVVIKNRILCSFSFERSLWLVSSMTYKRYPIMNTVRRLIVLANSWVKEGCVKCKTCDEQGCWENRFKEKPKKVRLIGSTMLSVWAPLKQFSH